MKQLKTNSAMVVRQAGFRLCIAWFLLSLSVSSAEAQFFSRFRRQPKPATCAASRFQYSAKDFRRQVAGDGFLVTLDRSLSLSEQQSERFRQILDARWQAGWTESGIQSGAKGLPAIREALDELELAALRRFLRPSQLNAFDSSDQVTVQFIAENLKPLDQWTVEELVDRQSQYFESVARLKIEELQTLCHLSTRQITELETAAELALAQLLAEQKSAFRLLKKSGVKNGVTPEVAARLNTPVGLQLSAQSDWLSAVNSVVEPACLAKYNARQSVRLARANHFGAAVVAIRVGELAKLSDGQQAELTRQLLAKSNGQFSTQQEFLVRSNSLAQRDLKSIRTDQQWDRFKSVADQLVARD